MHEKISDAMGGPNRHSTGRLRLLVMQSQGALLQHCHPERSIPQGCGVEGPP